MISGLELEGENSSGMLKGPRDVDIGMGNAEAVD